MKTKETIDLICQVFEQYTDKVIFAYLFESAVRNSDFPQRDIDIAVFMQAQTRGSFILGLFVQLKTNACADFGLIFSIAARYCIVCIFLPSEAKDEFAAGRTDCKKIHLNSNLYVTE